ncbi:MAG: hypothetical protein C0506_12270 [Anaerolinea sp.]|nr:hypothetical protein [Anaerolinea sp.]
MGTMTEDRDEGAGAAVVPVRDADLVTMPRCARCNLAYMPTKSTSALRLTYCSFLCELGDLGFSMTGLEHMERVKKPVEVAAVD